VDAGRIFGWLGRNGSGKSTTVRILTTLIRPSAGRARVAGHDVGTEPGRVRAASAATMDSAALDPAMTVREQLAFVAGLTGRSARAARRAADEGLAAMGLTSAADRLTGACSLGMQRRLDLATALLRRPQVLFLDEPTTGLDAQSRRALWEKVRALRDDGVAVFLTTQYLEEAELLADDVAILDGGRVVAQGTPAELAARHGEIRLRLRLGGTPAPDTSAPDTTSAPDASAMGTSAAAGPALAGVRAADLPDAGPDGWVRVAVPSVDAALAILARLRDAGVEISRFALDYPSLEDVFLTATGAGLLPPPSPPRSNIPETVG
jgi:ABC-2 type transport system ATP-binding protein